MGDARRHRMFEAFINRTYPSLESVLIVAGGKGRLARLLAKKGVQVRVIEADPRYSGNPESLITYEKGRFDRNSSVREDLIVGCTLTTQQPRSFWQQIGIGSLSQLYLVVCVVRNQKG